MRDGADHPPAIGGRTRSSSPSVRGVSRPSFCRMFLPLRNTPAHSDPSSRKMRLRSRGSVSRQSDSASATVVPSHSRRDRPLGPAIPTGNFRKIRATSVAYPACEIASSRSALLERRLTANTCGFWQKTLHCGSPSQRSHLIATWRSGCSWMTSLGQTA